MTLTLNRVRHLVRRLRTAPRSLVLFRLGLVARQIAWWPRVAWSRMVGPRADAPALSGLFRLLAADLEREVRTRASHDGEFVMGMKKRMRWVLDEQRLPCLGYGFVDVPTGETWRSDQVTGYRWRDCYFPFVNFLTHGCDADVKVPWELSRLQWVVWLAEAAVVDDGELGSRARERLECVIDDWVRANPLGYGPNWTVSMEVAIRAVNIGTAAAIAWNHLSESARTRVATMLGEHLAYLRAFPEKSDHPGNHYLLNLTGLVFLEGLVFADLRVLDADGRWFADVSAQFEPDGIHIEHAPLYHRLCVEALLWTVAFASRAGLHLPPDTASLVGRCCGALAALTLQTENLPVLGDADSGQVLSFGSATRDLDYIQRLLGLRPGGAALLATSAGSDAPLRGTMHLSRIPPADGLSRVGPYIRLRKGLCDVSVRAGRHGLYGLATHDHDDNGSPWVSLGGDDLLAEAGCYSYTRNLRKRTRDIASRSHNLLLVDDAERFTPLPGSISPSVAHAPIARLKRNDVGAVSISLLLEWQDRVAGMVCHSRLISIDSDWPFALRIEDSVSVEREALLRLRWHFAPSWTLAPGQLDTVLASATSAARAVSCAVRAPGVTSRVPLEIGTYSCSLQYGHVQQAWLLEARLGPVQSAHVVTTFEALTSAAG